MQESLDRHPPLQVPPEPRERRQRLQGLLEKMDTGTMEQPALDTLVLQDLLADRAIPELPQTRAAPG